ncbi:MAG: hypothetical protein B7Z69_00555 [Actinobacteria bacterium 21-73-9]|nr:MAG: hypothetical protein B7Z69_00555 [Actinobacteria bacterium 21-73-9]
MLISPLMFQQAVYNLAGDVLLNIAQDQADRGFFSEYRDRLGLNDFVPGMIGSASDTGTSQALANPDWVRTLTLGNLQNLKTPYGRAYLAIAQNYGTWFAMS